MIKSKLKDLEDAYQVKAIFLRSRLEKFGGRRGVVGLVRDALKFQKAQDFQKELDLLQPLVDFLEEVSYRSTKSVLYVCISDEMEWSIYLQKHPASLKRVVKNISEICPIDNVLRQYGMAAWELGDYTTATKALKLAIKWNPASSSCRSLLAMVYMDQNRWNDAFKVTLEALDTAYTPSSISRCYRFIENYFGKKNKFEECFYFCWFRTRFANSNQDYKEIADKLLFFYKKLRESQDTVTEETLLKAVRKYKIPLDINSKIFGIAVKRYQEESLAGNKGLAEYFSKILSDLQKCKTKGKNTSLKANLGRYKN